MASDEDVSRMNEGLYEDGKVFWRGCCGWTSKLWQRLAALGWSCWRSPAGFQGFTDPDGHKINTGCIGRAAGLVELAKIMR